MVSIWEYFNDMKERDELEAITLDGIHYHFMKWDSKLWLRTWDHYKGEYTWVVYSESD